MGKKAKSFKNMVAVAISTVASTIMVFVARKFFIDELGVEYAGINSLFSSIMSMLAVAELGIGSTIVFHLYKPIVNEDHAKVRSLMSLYRKIYYILGGIIFVIGMMVTPFIYKITGSVDIEYSLYVIFPLFVFDAAFSYFLSYKRSILFVHQDNYIIDAIHTVSILVVNTLQIIFLVLTGDFIIYLIIKIIFGVAENIVISAVANRKYKHIFTGTRENVDASTKASIKKLVKGSHA